MDSITFELFFSRIGRLDRSLKNLEKEIPEFNHTEPLLNEEEFELELPSDLMLKAERTTEPFKWLFAFENDLRNQLREVLEEKMEDEDWLNKLNLDDETRKIINQRMKNEQDSLSSSRINSDELDFCTLPELKEIIVKNWKMFEENYPRGARFLDNIIRDINRYRIIVAHFSELSKSDKQNLRDRLTRFYNPMSN